MSVADNVLTVRGEKKEEKGESRKGYHLSERRYVYDYQFEGVQDAEWVVLDYEESAFSLERFDRQVAAVEAMGYVGVAQGYGLALLRKS